MINKSQATKSKTHGGEMYDPICLMPIKKIRITNDSNDVILKYKILGLKSEWFKA